MLRSPVFWLMFVMMSMMSTGGLMVITQFTSFAKSFGITAQTSVVILGMAFAAIPAALTFDRITNGLTRPFFGWVSDHIGRENTMAIAFILEGMAIFLMLQYRSDPYLLVVLSGLVLGRDLFVVSVDIDRYFRNQICDHQLRLSLHGARRRLDTWRTHCRDDLRGNWQLDAGIWAGDRYGCPNRTFGAVRT